MFFNKNKETVTTMAIKEYNVVLPPLLAQNPDLEKAEIKVEENQIIIQVASKSSRLPELWIYVPSKSRWSIFKFKT